MIKEYRLISCQKNGIVHKWRQYKQKKRVLDELKGLKINILNTKIWFETSEYGWKEGKWICEKPKKELIFER
jgi:hypothetical protein